jgi:hypothetical protein
MELMCFFSSDDLAEIENVKTLLEKNDVLVMVKNAYTQNLFGGLKPFSGHDPVAGSIQIFINENDYDKAIAIIDQSGLFPEKIEDEQIENENIGDESQIDKTNDDDTEFMENAKLKRDIYFASLLTALSFLIIPYIGNLFLLYKIGKKRKPISITLFIVGTILFAISLYAFINSR